MRVADRLRLDLAMQVGALTEEVTVAAGRAAARNQHANARLGDRSRAGRGPAAARPQSVLARRCSRRACSTRRRSASRSNRPFDNGGMDNFQISGGRAFTNEFLLDGVPNTGTETTQPNNLSFVPSPDATAEFSVQTSIYDAQYGRTGGGVVNVVLKSGTNQFHGAVYEYYRDEKLNANTFDANRGGHRQGRASTGVSPALTLDGPVRIPGLYDGTDKTFFMYYWEQIRSEVPFPQVYTVPSALERSRRLLADADRRRPSGHDLRSADDAPGERPVHARCVPGQRDSGEPHRSGRAGAPAARAAAEHRRPGQQPARARQRARRQIRPARVQGRSGDQRNQRFFARFARNKRTEINDYAAFPPEASPWYQHGRMNVGLRRRATSVLRPSLVLSSRVGFIRHEFYMPTHGDNFDPTDARVPGELRLAARAPDVPADSVGRLHHVRQHVRRQQRQHVHDQRHVVVVGSAQQDDGQPLVQDGRRVPRAGQQSAEPDLVVRPLHVQSRVHAAQRAGAPTSTPATRWPRCCSAIRPTARRRPIRACRRSFRSSTIAATTTACSCRTTGASTRG